MVDIKVTIPLMIRPEDDIKFVEEDYDTVSDNEPSMGIKRHSGNSSQGNENAYKEISQKEKFMHFLKVPKSPISRSVSSESSEGGGIPNLARSSSGKKKHHEYEKISVSSTPRKKISLERITDGSFFRRRQEILESKRSEKNDEEEHILEALRHVVRKCTSIDPMKRPSSSDVIDLFSSFNDKS